MSDNLILVGTGPMSVEYTKVLNALGTKYTVVGRGENSTNQFFEKTGIKAVCGGLNNFLESNISRFNSAIVAVGVDQLYETTCALIKHGIKKILLEKPGGINEKEISELSKYARENNANVFLAYNRRFYASVIEATKFIELDGGIKSMQFDFTEWSHIIEKLDKPIEIKQSWLLANSSHVIDLAFYFGGNPVKMHSVSSGKLSWHPKSVFSGSGITNKNVLFSYHANWESAGGWKLELQTNERKLIFRPMEELHIQLRGKGNIVKHELNNEHEKEFKHGLYFQTKYFVEGNNSEMFIDIHQQSQNVKNIYNEILFPDNEHKTS